MEKGHIQTGPDILMVDPCPYCGGALDVNIYTYDDCADRYYVECLGKCKQAGPMKLSTPWACKAFKEAQRGDWNWRAAKEGEKSIYSAPLMGPYSEESLREFWSHVTYPPPFSPKPCPAFHSSTTIEQGPVERCDAYHVWCQDCYTTGPRRLTKTDALKSWNLLPRKGDPA